MQIKDCWKICKINKKKLEKKAVHFCWRYSETFPHPVKPISKMTKLSLPNSGVLHVEIQHIAN